MNLDIPGSRINNSWSVHDVNASHLLHFHASAPTVVIHRHEVSAPPSHDDYARRILGEIEAGGGVSQRALSRKMGIALGLTNLLLRRSIDNGWIRVRRVRANRVVYLLTPNGIAQKARMTRACFAASIRFYGETRQRVHDRF